MLNETLKTGLKIALLAAVAGTASGQVVNEDDKLLAADGSFEDNFGGAVSVDDNYIVVGAYGDDVAGENSGSIYVFDAMSRKLVRKISPTDGSGGDFFGAHVAMSNGILAVTAVGDDDNGPNSGSVYLIDAGSGQVIHKLLADDGEGYDHFGTDVDIDNGLVVVGAFFEDTQGSNAGAAYVFDVSTGEQLYKLMPEDNSAGDEFGVSVAISGNRIVVGAYLDNHSGTYAGSAYIFNTSSGSLVRKLIPAGVGSGDTFGRTVAIHNGTICVSSVSDDDNGSASGAVYTFNASNGVLLRKISPNDGAAGDFFGNSLAISGGVIAVGTRGDDGNGSESGSAYLFDAQTGTQLAKLLPSDGAADDNFGYRAIDIFDETIIVGAHNDDDNGENSGSSYIFDMQGPCDVDLNGDGQLNFLDVVEFLSSYSAGELTVDFNGDGSLSFFDVSSFLQSFTAGCP